MDNKVAPIALLKTIAPAAVTPATIIFSYLKHFNTCTLIFIFWIFLNSQSPR